MKILITNDDGFHAEGLQLLVEKAKKYGEILVVAPLVEQSAKSHSICVRRGIKIAQSTQFSGIKSYVVDSTPADCVRYAYYGLHEDFDIVFSGINRGFNLGDDIFYSGTVAGANEGALTGKKAIAFSSDWQGYEGAITHFEAVMEYIFQHKMLEKADVLNVNFPRQVKGIKIAKQGYTHYDCRFDQENEEYFQRGKPRFDLEKEKTDSDVHAINDNYITITPLTIDRTDLLAYNEIVAAIMDKNKK
jgi:5'-nucleotidase